MTVATGQRHLALIIEDDARMAEMVVEIVSAAGCDSKVCDNFEDALTLFNGHRFCIVLLDLSIKRSADSMKDSTAHGRSALRAIRELSQHHTGKCWWLPIIVTSAHLGDRDEAVHVMRDGATAIIDKASFGERVLTDWILAELKRCGRMSHIGCDSRPIPPAVSEADVPIRLPGTRVDRRTIIYIGEARAKLANADLKTLLRLLVAGKTGLHKSALGAKDTGFQAISRLRVALEPVLAELDIVANDHHGQYWLIAGVRVVECNAVAHVAIGDRDITEWTKKIARSSRRGKKT